MNPSAPEQFLSVSSLRCHLYLLTTCGIISRRRTRDHRIPTYPIRNPLCDATFHKLGLTTWLDSTAANSGVVLSNCLQRKHTYNKP